MYGHFTESYSDFTNLKLYSNRNFYLHRRRFKQFVVIENCFTGDVRRISNSLIDCN